MTEQNATPENWAQIKAWVELGSVRDKCVYALYQQVLELQAQVAELEVNTMQWRIDHLHLANATAKLAPDRAQFFADTARDNDEA